MQPIEQALVSFFQQVAQKDEGQLKRLQQEQRFSMEPGRWCFSLPDLHRFLQHQDEAFSRIDYRQFRQLIFSSPINQTVKSYGAEITIAHNQGKVDRSSYALVWRTP